MTQHHEEANLSDEQWLEVLAPQDNWNERHFLSLIATFGFPTSYLDIGCGTGAMVNVARKLGLTAYGVDLIQRPELHFFKHDLHNTFLLDEHVSIREVALVTSLEVAEHIRPERHDIFCQTINLHVARTGMLVFSAASPGQAGEGHIGVKHAPYWRKKFHDLELYYQEYLTARIRSVWLSLNSPLYWLAGNVQVFTR